jgi:DNA-binding LytR/AlgR family response regulator
MNGFEFVTELRKSDKFAAVPVIFLTASQKHPEYRKAMTSGANDFLRKPANLFEVLEAVQAQLWRKRSLPSPPRSRVPEPGLPREHAPETGSNTLLIFVNHNGHQQFLKTTEIKAITADGEYSRLHWDDNKSVLYRKSLRRWARDLPAGEFFQIHRQAIINFRFFQFLDVANNNGPKVKLRNFSLPLSLSKRSAPAFRKFLKRHGAKC